MNKKSLTLAFLLSQLFSGMMPAAQAIECKSSTQKNCTVTIRYNRGLKIGTENRGNNGTTTIRDDRGIKQETIETKPGRSNCEVIRNSRGIKVGTRGNC